MNSKQMSYLGTMALLAGLIVLPCAKADVPAWWITRGVIDTNASPNDFAAVNQGQVKNVASNACAEMQANLPAGAGSNVLALINSFSPTNNYFPATIGQLKNVGSVFYDRLIYVGYTNAYPWSSTTNDDNDYAVANIGQLKNLFNWDISTDTVGDAIPDWWREHYFGSGTTTNETSCASCDPDGDGFTNWQEYQSGTDPQDPDSHPNSMLIIAIASAVYLSSNSVQVSANTLSTNALVNVKGAEYFLDVVTGTNGTGTTMSAADGGFDSTNETAVANFTPTFPYGERHVIYLHAQGSDGQWTPFKQVILNPNANDILAAIQANYGQITTLSYSASISYFIDGDLQTNPVTVAVQQKGSTKLRQVDPSTGDYMIQNGGRIAYFDSAGDFMGGYQIGATNDLAAGEDHLTGAYYWDTVSFRNEHPSLPTGSFPAGGSGLVSFNAGAQVQGIYTNLSMIVDMIHRTAAQETYWAEDGSQLQITHANPVQLQPGLWLPSSETVQANLADGTVLQWQVTYSSFQINVPLDDSLFNIPNNP